MNGHFKQIMNGFHDIEAQQLLQFINRFRPQNRNLIHFNKIKIFQFQPKIHQLSFAFFLHETFLFLDLFSHILRNIFDRIIFIFAPFTSQLH